VLRLHIGRRGGAFLRGKGGQLRARFGVILDHHLSIVPGGAQTAGRALANTKAKTMGPTRLLRIDISWLRCQPHRGFSKASTMPARPREVDLPPLCCPNMPRSPLPDRGPPVTRYVACY
jgi:hypothetical protein